MNGGRLNQASGEILNFTDHLDIYHSKRVHEKQHTKKYKCILMLLLCL